MFNPQSNELKVLPTLPTKPLRTLPTLLNEPPLVRLVNNWLTVSRRPWRMFVEELSQDPDPNSEFSKLTTSFSSCGTNPVIPCWHAIFDPNNNTVN